MLGFFRKRSEPHREVLLSAVPAQNELVRTEECGKGLRLIAPLRPSAMRRAFAGKSASKIPREKKFELDDLGAWVWNQINGRRTVESLIESFAKHFRVNVREAEVSVVAFLKILTQRNLIAHVAPKFKSRRIK